MRCSITYHMLKRVDDDDDDGGNRCSGRTSPGQEDVVAELPTGVQPDIFPERQRPTGLN